MVKSYYEMLTKQGNRLGFLFSLTTHYQNHEFVSISSEWNKALRDVLDFSHKKYFNNSKGYLIRCYVKKNLNKFTFRLKSLITFSYGMSKLIYLF